MINKFYFVNRIISQYNCVAYMHYYIATLHKRVIITHKLYKKYGNKDQLKHFAMGIKARVR